MSQRKKVLGWIAVMVFFLVSCSGPATKPNIHGGGVAEFVIVMEGFSQDERDSMEEMLEEMTGYVSLRPKTNEDNGPVYQAYWYKTKMRSAKLQRDIRKAMEGIGVRGITGFSGNEISVTKTGRN